MIINRLQDLQNLSAKKGVYKLPENGEGDIEANTIQLESEKEDPLSQAVHFESVSKIQQILGEIREQIDLFKGLEYKYDECTSSKVEKEIIERL
jgi:hypothetical protein